MSSADDVAKQAICKAYLREMFELNPMWQSSQILRRRREIWTGKSNPLNAAGKFVSSSASGVSDSDEDAATLRNQERVRRCMETLQEQFYRLPSGKLNQYLRFVQSDKRPEINVKVKRLTAVAEHRDALLQLQRESTDSKFSYSLCQGLISPPAQAGSLKEQYIESIIAEKRVGPSCKMVRKFVHTHPGVYQLERDWFDLFLDPANERQWSSRYSLQGRFKSVTGNNRVNVLAFVGLFIFFAVIRAANTEPKNSPQQQPTFRMVQPADNQPETNDTSTESRQESAIGRWDPVESRRREIEAGIRREREQSAAMSQGDAINSRRNSSGSPNPAELDSQLLRPNAWIKDIQRESTGQPPSGLPGIGFPTLDEMRSGSFGTGIPEIDEQLFTPPDLPVIDRPNFELPPQFGPRGLNRAGRKPEQLGDGQFP